MSGIMNQLDNCIIIINSHKMMASFNDRRVYKSEAIYECGEKVSLTDQPDLNIFCLGYGGSLPGSSYGLCPRAFGDAENLRIHNGDY
jgi:hypothetical protein